jgi:protoheme IX farnesyltransferase
MIKEYYRLAKPGIIYGNFFAAIAGFFLAAKGHIDVGLLAAMLGGLAGIFGSACVFNNYLDRDIDSKMARTQKRAMVSGSVPPTNALIFGTALFMVGAFLLLVFVNSLAFWVAWAGFVVYVLVYTPLKRKTVHGTLIGSVAGAVPPVVGYVAITNHLDGGAWLLFLILVFWQMPHFYGIALRRQQDYAAAKIPVLPIVSGARAAKIHTLAYIVAFIFACVLLFAYGYIGHVALVVSVFLGLLWFGQGLRNFNSLADKLWGKKIFLFSLITLVGWSVVISLNVWLR